MTPRAKNVRLAQPIGVNLLSRWFDEELPPKVSRPSRERLYTLADELKVLLHRANNVEMGRSGPVPFAKLKDVSPAEEFRKRLNAIVEAVIEFQNYAGPVMNAPKGDVYLADFEHTVRMIRGMYAPPGKPKNRRGKPASPWIAAARKFALSIQAVLKEIGFHGRVSIASPLSVPILIVTKAINHAYGSRIKPEAVVSALRERNRSKRKTDWPY